MKGRLKEALVNISRARNDGYGLQGLERFLFPFLSASSSVYNALVSVRRALYKSGVFQPKRLPVPVVSVGNVTWGGNGKTPMTEFLAWCFLRAGIRPMVLTRGYGGGDEAQMLASHFDGFPVEIGVGADRVDVASSLLKRCGVLKVEDRSHRANLLDVLGDQTFPQSSLKDSGIGVAILDDGMQHLRIERDVEVAMVNALALFGNERLIPCGPLREPVDALKLADVIVIHHANLVSQDELQAINMTLKKLVGESEPVFVYSTMTPQHFFRSTRQASDETVPLTAVQGAHVLCVSGLGCPESLSLCLAQLGAAEVQSIDYVDHHEFKEEDMLLVEKVKAEQRIRCLVTSEKDYMRSPAIWRKHEALVLCSSLKLINCSGLKRLQSLLVNVMTETRKLEPKPSER